MYWKIQYIHYIPSIRKYPWNLVSLDLERKNTFDFSFLKILLDEYNKNIMEHKSYYIFI